MSIPALDFSFGKRIAIPRDTAQPFAVDETGAGAGPLVRLAIGRELFAETM